MKVYASGYTGFTSKEIDFNSRRVGTTGKPAHKWLSARTMVEKPRAMNGRALPRNRKVRAQ